MEPSVIVRKQTKAEKTPEAHIYRNSCFGFCNSERHSDSIRSLWYWKQQEQRKK